MTQRLMIYDAFLQGFKNFVGIIFMNLKNYGSRSLMSENRVYL